MAHDLALADEASWRAVVAALRAPLLVALLFGACITGAGGGKKKYKCFCDKRNCEDQLMCEGEACLIGFRSDVQLDQQCGAEGALRLVKQCAKDSAGWVEVCSCAEDFCNTFSFLRSQMAAHEKELDADGFSFVDPQRRPADMHPQTDDFDNPIQPRKTKPNQLIILLVIVPLGVGAAAVCLVFLNYHCRMC